MNYLTSAQVAARLGIARQTVVRLAHRGALPSFRPARRYLFTLEDVEAYAARCTRAARRPDQEEAPHE